jgi:hypothetical protein
MPCSAATVNCSNESQARSASPTLFRLAVMMPSGSFGEDGPGFGGGSDSEVG